MLLDGIGRVFKSQSALKPISLTLKIIALSKSKSIATTLYYPNPKCFLKISKVPIS
jgi:hypothetical protein